MKPETLESLMIDRALNELQPEVGELLDAYLAQNPAAAAGVAQIEDTMRLARQAVPVPEEVPQRAFVPNSFSEPRRHAWLEWLRVPRLEFVRVMAGLALGLALGWMLPSLWKATEVAQGPSPARYVIADARTDRAGDSVSRFWSLAAVAAERQARSDAGRPARQQRLQWDSLFKTP